MDCRWRSGRLRLKCDGTRAETRFPLSAKRTSPFKSAAASVQPTNGSWGVRISGSNAGYTMLRGSVKGTGYPVHSPVSPSLPLPVSPCAITFQLKLRSRYYVPYLHRRSQHANTASSPSPVNTNTRPTCRRQRNIWCSRREETRNA